MEFSVTQENLARALNNVGRVASARAGLAVLGNVLIRTDGTRLLVAATNLEIASTHYIGAKVTAPGSITIPAKLVAEFVSSLPKGTVDISVKGTRMTIASGPYTSVINGVDAEEFPELPAIDEQSAIHYSLSVADFKQAVAQTSITASNDTTRPVLTGVYWHSDGDTLSLAATDGYRLSERQLVKTESSVAAIIPTSSLHEVVRTLSDGDDEIDVLFDETQVRFRVNDAEITSRLIDGNYPDYKQLIPTTAETKVVIKTADLLRTTKIAALFARSSGGSITLSANADTQKLAIHSIASELGENTSEVDVEVTVSGQVTLNSRYLIEALGVIDAEQVSFSFNGKLSPVIIRSTAQNSNYFHIIMPLKS